MRDSYQQQFFKVANLITEIHQHLEKRLRKANMKLYLESGASLASIILKIARISIVASETAEIASAAARVAGEGLAIAGVVFSVVLLPFDIFFFGSSVKALSKGEKSKLAEDIRQWLYQEPFSDDQISSILNNLKKQIIDYGCKAKLELYGSKQNSHEFKESEKQLRETFENVMKELSFKNKID